VHTGPEVAFGVDLMADDPEVYTMLFDPDDTVLDVYQRLDPLVPFFPLAYLIDATGTIVQVYGDYGDETVLPPTLLDDLAALLGPAR